MKTVFFLVGNYGVGKSTIINEPIISKEKLLIEIRDNIFILGTNICGADSLSNYKKDYIINYVKENNDKNIIITGNYYSQIKDIKELSIYFKIILIYLVTSFENNAKRIALRGKNINVDTYNNKLKSHLSLIKQTKGFRKLYILDNNKNIIEVKKDFYNIIKDEKN